MCQNGGTVGPWRAAEMTAPSIQRIAAEGEPAEIIATAIDGIALNGPNDLVFGPDGRLYITDPGTYRPDDPEPSRIFVLDESGGGALLVELDPPTFPNGIAIEADGSVVWAESYTGMVRRCRPDGIEHRRHRQAPGRPPRRRRARRRRRRAAVRDHASTAGVSTCSTPTARYDQHIEAGSIPTNCVFDGSRLL